MANEFPSSADYTALGWSQVWFTYKKNWLKWHKAATNEIDVKMVQDVSTGMHQTRKQKNKDIQ